MSKLNGTIKRRLESWIDSFVATTSNLEAPEIFRKWSAITAIAATLEQKVWITTSEQFYPNLYTILVGDPASGKTRSVMAARAYLAELPEFHIAPTSVLMGSLVDCLAEAKRFIPNLPYEPIEYNSITLVVDEFGAFMHEYNNELVAGLTTFYDVTVPYGQQRRGRSEKIKIKRPQLNILAGSTPSNLIKFMPEIAWDQGFTSRIMLIYSSEKNISSDVFATKGERKLNDDLVHDLKNINTVIGEFTPTDEYRTAVSNWTKLNFAPTPRHPKLTHYCGRRRGHMFKLSMVSSVDRGDSLTLTVEDFNRAMNWLHEAELFMPDLFSAGTGGGDAKVMDEIWHLIQIADTKGHGVSEHRVVKFAGDRVPSHSVLRVLEVMERSGMIQSGQPDAKTGLRSFRALPRD